MKICFITNLFPPFVVGGAEIVVDDLARQMQQMGHDVIVISTLPNYSPKTSVEIINGIKIYRFYPLNVYSAYRARNKIIFFRLLWHLIDIWNIHSFLMVRKILFFEKPDIVNTHNIPGLSSSVWAATKSLGILIVHTLHDYYLLCSKLTLFKGQICRKQCSECNLFSLFKCHYAKSIDAIIAPSKFILDYHLSRGLFFSIKKDVIYNGIAIDPRFVITQKDQKALIKFLYVGQVNQHKGVDFLLETYSRMPNSSILYIVGVGKSLLYLKDKYLKNENIIFLNYLSGREKASIFEQSDVLILPSLWLENSPKAIYEAYSYGMPVIASRIGGIPELVDEKQTGFLFLPGDASELAGKMTYLVDNPQVIERLRNNCLNYARKFSINEQAHKYLSFFNYIIKNKPQECR